MQNSKISFTSGIQITDSMGFFQQLQKMPKKILVGRPYTINEIERAPQIFTKGIFNCSAVGITVKNKNNLFWDSVFLHLDPENKDNYKFRLLEEKVLEKINDDEVIGSIFYGSLGQNEKLFDQLKKQTKNNKELISFLLDHYDKHPEKSVDLISSLINMFKEKFKKPCSQIIGNLWDGHYGCLAFNGEENKYILHNSAINSVKENEIKILIPKIYEKTELSPNDFFIYG